MTEPESGTAVADVLWDVPTDGSGFLSGVTGCIFFAYGFTIEEAGRFFAYIYAVL